MIMEGYGSHLFVLLEKVPLSGIKSIRDLDMEFEIARINSYPLGKLIDEMKEVMKVKRKTRIHVYSMVGNSFETSSIYDSAR